MKRLQRKFRAWDKEESKMWKVVSMSESIWGDCEEAYVSVCDFDKSPGDKDTDIRGLVYFDLMQFTGLKDINGKDIYEGDIVKCYQSHNSLVCSKMYSYGLDTKGMGFTPFYEVYGQCEIIGNIHENPELLEVQHERD